MSNAACTTQHHEIGQDSATCGGTDPENEESLQVQPANHEAESGSPHGRQIENSLPESVVCQSDPRFMQISNQDHQRAMKIKCVVEATPNLESLSDVMYVQLAILCKGDVEHAMNHVYNLQAFKQEYTIVDSWEEGKELSEDLVRNLFPGWLLSFDFDEDHGNSFIALDLTKVDKRSFQCPRTARRIFAGLYYMFQALFPNLEVVRKGHTQVVECEGFDLSRNMVDINIFVRLMTEIHGSYPTAFGGVYFYHTPMAINLMLALAKRSLPEHLVSNIVMGCTFVSRLDQFYAIPTLEAASQRALDKIQESLRIRYENEHTFSL
ncbi:unknown protein [Seminavis robusta]|uniref:CRAL-TRIO domain-containing protein n=1 Tax=Seminavis robusta TaxID=568900 RepID=A0A9N8DNT0_9STRA|nr:unknown protein [Seminavis robusta]|eukprot:Sro265_g102810.1 n/a (322) ;mRNA; f:43674-44727